MRLFLLITYLAFVSVQFAKAEPPRVLAVTAHPDDETLFSTTLYAISHHLDGIVDLAVITDGAGGFKYSTLAEAVYQSALTKETIGRQELPDIRKRELQAAGKIIGIRKYFFLEQADLYYTKDIKQVLENEWNVEQTRRKLRHILKDGSYDFVFTMLPNKETHAHHSASAIVLLQAVRSLGKGKKPIALAATVRSKEDKQKRPVTLRQHPISSLRGRKPGGVFDRTHSFGHQGKLNYQIIANWVIAEHKSQGSMQLFVNRGDIEEFWLYNINPQGSEDKTLALFQDLERKRYR